MNSRSSTEHLSQNSQSQPTGVWERFRLAQAEQGSASAGGSADEASKRRIALEEITVTGSRIQREGFEAPTPTTLLGAEQIAIMAPHNIADAVNQLPVLGSGPTTRTNGVATGGAQAGFNALNLHSWGGAGGGIVKRTLVMLDGRRIAGSNSGGFVNINTIPQQLVDRVEVVTGGASAAYGSDAVAGVVNFILKKDFSGFSGDMQGGVSRYGDAAERKFTGSFGQSFAGDRGHLLLSASYSQADGINEIASRDWYDNTKLVSNVPGATSALIFAPNVNTSVMTAGGLIIRDPANGPLQGIQFGAGGAPSNFEFGRTIGSVMVGGQANDFSAFQPLAAEVENRSFFSRVTFDVNDSLDVVAEGSYGGSTAISPTTFAFKLGNLRIQRDNAFLPDSVRTQMTNAGLTSVSFGTWNGDIGKVRTDNDLDSYRGVLAAGRYVDAQFLLSVWTHRRTEQCLQQRHQPTLQPSDRCRAR